MARRLDLSLSRAREARALRHWARLAAQAESAAPAQLRRLRSRAVALKRELDRVIHVADGRLASPRLGAGAIDRPANADWACRPSLWRGPLPGAGAAAAASGTRLAEDVSLFHDCRHPELTARQIPTRRAEDASPYGLRLDVFHFDGSFLSVVIDLPSEALSGLRRQSIVGLDAALELERPLEMFARLNVRHGPNTEQIVQEVAPAPDGARAEFDLAYAAINEKRLERVWIDLIFEKPWMNQITLRDVTANRRPRAQM